ncbi:hypothetical protein CLAFUW4_09005 [Fulvia fulva]|nr:hypothetical protein CLAFUR4_09011 [Fulvia fulva]KAK4615001.1 hypothetical protein CLAFUR0_09003 [Fulvia fulva]WPV20108.1 hypothetical protein CLAFUW4_09005 [Fulvia fulva]WPV35520.1 hypothetical protein CLAFUW7_09006 [Fulvia fulva]
MAQAVIEAICTRRYEQQPRSILMSATPPLQDDSIQDASNAAEILPDNWPQNIVYLSDLKYTEAALELKPKLTLSPSDTGSWTKIPIELTRSPCSRVKIVTIGDQKHPAYGQRGLFAAENLIPDAFILPYVGEVHCNSLSDTNPHSDYDLSLDREIGLSVDSAYAGNEARCCNDYRGVAERANAEWRDCYVQVPSMRRAGGKRWERRVGIFVVSAGKAGKRTAGIKAGEEILINYGKGFWEGRKTLVSE